MKPRLLDLFAGAGGSAKGYQRAGFYVVGVDIKAQPNYCGDEFYQADALTFLDAYNFVDERKPGLVRFDAIHASPPCQAYSAAAEIHDSSARHPDLVALTRQRLRETGVPWVMENVERSPLRTSLVLCGSMFNLGVRRHRWFESNVLMLAPPCGSHSEWYCNVYGGRTVGRQRVTKAGPGTRTQTWDKFDDELAVGSAAMGVSWMTLKELSEAVPPAYTAWIGERLLASLELAA